MSTQHFLDMAPRIGILAILLFVLLSVFTSSAYGCGLLEKPCGKTCCKVTDYCEEGVDGVDTCYPVGSKIDCSYIYYCYKPTSCCGFSSCCPANSTCCGYKCCHKDSTCCGKGFGHCCPPNSICCGVATCCPEGSTCKSGFQCITKSSSSILGSRWYLSAVIVIPMIIVALLLRQRLLRRRRNAQNAGRVLSTNTGGTDTSMANAHSFVPAYDYNAPPPSYTEIGHNPSPGMYEVSPPPYEEVVKIAEQNDAHNSSQQPGVDQTTLSTQQPGVPYEQPSQEHSSQPSQAQHFEHTGRPSDNTPI